MQIRFGVRRQCRWWVCHTHTHYVVIHIQDTMSEVGLSHAHYVVIRIQDAMLVGGLPHAHYIVMRIQDVMSAVGLLHAHNVVIRTKDTMSVVGLSHAHYVMMRTQDNYNHNHLPSMCVCGFCCNFGGQISHEKSGFSQNLILDRTPYGTHESVGPSASVRWSVGLLVR